MATGTPDPAYLEPYRKAVAAGGATWGAQLWRSPEAQRARFDAIAGMVEHSGRDVVDMGCGQGDLAAYLAERTVAWRSYLGVDAIQEVVSAAEARARDAGWAGASFRRGDLVADEGLPELIASASDSPVVVFSGSLNTLEVPGARRVIERFWDGACAAPGSALVFNFLCMRWGEPASVEGDPARRFDAEAMATWAMGLSARARYRRDYLGDRDATIALFRGP